MYPKLFKLHLPSVLRGKMKLVVVKKDDKKAVDKAAKILAKKLHKGDIILTGPISENFFAKYLHVTLILSKRLLRGITHSCIYLGNNQVLDIEYKMIRSTNTTEKITLQKLIKLKTDEFGGVIVYVVSPTMYTAYQRKMVVEESKKSFLSGRKISHTPMGSLILGWRYMFQRKGFYAKHKEDLTFGTDWTCSHMVAHILKKKGVKIGNRASYTFVPPIFAASKHFRIKGKVMVK
jgi:hypothetical protein